MSGTTNGTEEGGSSVAYSYVTRLLDVERNPIGYASDQVDVSTTRRINEATEITITVPVSRDPALRQGAFIQRVRVHADGTEEVVGTARVSDRDRQADRTAYTARLDAALLENNVTPANYGPALSDLLLEDLVRQLVDGWRILRADIGTPLERSQVDTTTEPGRAMLAKQSNGRYYSSGFIVFRFDANDTPDWTAWDRIRWESDFFDSVSTTIQWRHGTHTGSMSTWSDPVQGADPTQTGVAIQGITSRFVDVRVNLATSDTTTPQDTPDGVNPTVWGFTPRVFGLELIARTTGQIQIGTLDIEPHVFARNVDADRANALRILVDQCEATGYEFTVTDGVLDVARQVGADRTNDFVLRNTSNTEIRALRDEDAQLVNRLHAYGEGAGLQQRYVFREDAQSVSLYGPYEATEQFDESSLVGLEAAADAYLAEHAHPIPQFQISGPDEHAITLGDRVRIADPRTGTVVTTRVTELTEREDRTRGRVIDAHLGAPPIGLIDTILGQAGGAGPPRLPLVPPLVQARRTAPGFSVEVTHAPRSRGVGFRVHYSTVSGFTPSVNTQRGEGNQSTFTFPRAAPGVLHFVRVASVDAQGNISSYTPEVPVRAGHVETAQIGPGAITDTELGPGAVTNPKMDGGALGQGTRTQASGVSVMRGNTEVLKIGIISGKPGVPSNINEGIWGALGTGAFFQGVPRIVTGGRLYSPLTDNGSIPSGQNRTITGTLNLNLGNFTVPTGRNYVLTASIIQMQANSANGVVPGNFNIRVHAGNQGGGAIPPGSYPGGATISWSVTLHNYSGSSQSSVMRLAISFLLLDVDISPFNQ